MWLPCLEEVRPQSQPLVSLDVCHSHLHGSTSVCECEVWEIFLDCPHGKLAIGIYPLSIFTLSYVPRSSFPSLI